MTPRTPLRLTASAVRAYQSCPYLYARTHLVPLPRHERDPVPHFLFGQLVHDVIAEFHRQGGWQTVSEERLRALLLARWQRSPLEAMEIESASLARANRLVGNFYTSRFPNGVARELGVERPLAWSQFRHGLLFFGRLDRLCQLHDGTIQVIDYKCGRLQLDESEILADVQALIYRSLAADAFHRLAPPETVVSYFHLSEAVSVTAVFDRDRFDAGWTTILETAERIRQAMEQVIAGVPVAESFPRRRGERCFRCVLRRHCAAVPLSADPQIQQGGM